MCFMTQSLASSKIHEEASGIWFDIPSNCQHVLCMLASSWFLRNLHLCNSDDTWCCTWSVQYLQQNADKYASLGSAWSVIHFSEYTTGLICHSLGWTLCNLTQVHLLEDLKGIFQHVPSDQKTHTMPCTYLQTGKFLCHALVHPGCPSILSKKWEELCHSKPCSSKSGIHCHGWSVQC